MINKRWNSFSDTNASQKRSQDHVLKLNRPTSSPPRGAVPVNQARCGRLFHSPCALRFLSSRRPLQLCEVENLKAVGFCLTNVLANGSPAASSGFDLVGNLQTVGYHNGVTNAYQYDSLNRLTNLVWQAGGAARAKFAFQLDLTGNRTNSTAAVNGTSR
jgi:hypothetical protein